MDVSRLSSLGRGKLVPLLNFRRIDEHVGDVVELLVDDMFVLLLFNNSLNSTSME